MSSIFTIHIDVFFKLPLFKEAIKAIQDQTYQNLEIIISNNGADQEITDFISETKKDEGPSFPEGAAPNDVNEEEIPF